MIYLSPLTWLVGCWISKFWNLCRKFNHEGQGTFKSKFMMVHGFLRRHRCWWRFMLGTDSSHLINNQHYNSATNILRGIMIWCWNFRALISSIAWLNRMHLVQWISSIFVNRLVISLYRKFMHLKMFYSQFLNTY